LLENVGDNILVVGTAHVSPESVKEVRDAIDAFRPDIVAVELDERRLKVLRDRKSWESTPITRLLEDRNAYVFIAQSFLASYQRRLGEKFGSEPGSEMLEAINAAEKDHIQVLLADRDITITLKRAWKKMTLREKMRIAWTLMSLPFIDYDEEAKELDLKELMKEDALTSMMNELKELAPNVAEVLLFERDTYIARRIADASHGKRVLAVVGAGHVKGVREKILKVLAQEKLPSFSELEYLPPKGFPWGKVLGWGIAVLLAALIVWIGIKNGPRASLEAFGWWFLIHAILSAVFCAAARGHPYSIGTAFIASPFTAIHPGVAAGWFSGLVEAKVRTPTVKDWQELGHSKTTKDFFNNRVIRVLMVAALTNVGSMIGTFVAFPYLIKMGLGWG
jgi:pheromone shutdown-related protein TraB